MCYSACSNNNDNTNTATDGDCEWSMPEYCEDEYVTRVQPFAKTTDVDCTATCTINVDCYYIQFITAEERDELIATCLNMCEGSGYHDFTQYENCEAILAAYAARPEIQIPTNELPECYQPESKPAEMPEGPCADACFAYHERCPVEFADSFPLVQGVGGLYPVELEDPVANQELLIFRMRSCNRKCEVGIFADNIERRQEILTTIPCEQARCISNYTNDAQCKTYLDEY